MEDIIKKAVLKLFPELSARYHLPVFGVVVGVRETPAEGDLCDPFRPFYAVDVQLLDEHGKPDTAWPVLKDVILSLPVAGQERGQFAYPDEGTWVEVAFAYGSPNRPFIRSVLPHELALPPVELGEQRWQHNADSFQQVDKEGNWNTKTDGAITQDSLSRFVKAMDAVHEYHSALKTTATDDSELIGSIKRIEAYGAMVLQSGGVLDIGAVDDARLTSKTKNLQKAPKTWLGSQTENVLGLLSELMQKVMDLELILEGHTHTGDDGGSTSAPHQAGAISSNGSAVGAIKTRLDGIKE